MAEGLQGDEWVSIGFNVPVEVAYFAGLPPLAVEYICAQKVFRAMPTKGIASNGAVEW